MSGGIVCYRRSLGGVKPISHAPRGAYALVVLLTPCTYAYAVQTPHLANNGCLSERGKDPSIAAGLVGFSLDRSLHPGGGMLYVRSCPCVIIAACTAGGGGPRGRPRAEEPSDKVYACSGAPCTLFPHTALLFHARWGKLVCGSWERCIAGRLEHSAHSLRALSANLLHGFGRFILSNERPAPVRCCNAS